MMGSGPKLRLLARLLASSAWVSVLSQVVGNFTKSSIVPVFSFLILAMPSNTKPSSVGFHVMAKPLARDCARAESSSAASRCASRSKAVVDASGMANITPALAMATMATTTINSISVKPCWQSLRRSARVFSLLPRTNVRILAFATCHAVRAKTHHINLFVDARVQILVGLAPGVVR